MHIYEARGLTITHVHADSKFKCIQNSIRPALLNLVAPGKHVSEVERSIRTIKERVRCMIHGLPYSTYPKLLIEACVTAAVKQLNAIPSKNGISQTMSPTTLLTGTQPVSYHNLVKMCFGAYAQVNVDNAITNTTEARTTGGIALYPTDNAQGNWYFASLNTGR